MASREQTSQALAGKVNGRAHHVSTLGDDQENGQESVTAGKDIVAASAVRRRVLAGVPQQIGAVIRN